MSSDDHDVNRRDVVGLWTTILLMPLLRVAFRARRFLRWRDPMTKTLTIGTFCVLGAVGFLMILFEGATPF